MTWNSGRSADWRHSDMDGTAGKLTTVRKRETPEELAERLGYLPHEEVMRRLDVWALYSYLPPCMRSE